MFGGKAFRVSIGWSVVVDDGSYSRFFPLFVRGASYVRVDGYVGVAVRCMCLGVLCDL